jgi:hypothetical protein
MGRKIETNSNSEEDYSINQISKFFSGNSDENIKKLKEEHLEIIDKIRQSYENRLKSQLSILSSLDSSGKF